MVGIDQFDTSEHPTYTEEEPNGLTVEEVRLSLAATKDAFPQHFAMTALGFATGLRFRSASVLDKPFREVALAIKVGRHATRDATDVSGSGARGGNVGSRTRAISGHATEQEAFSKLATRPAVMRDVRALFWLMTVVRNACLRMWRPFVRGRRARRACHRRW